MAETAHIAINEYPSRGELTILFSGQAKTEPHHRIGPTVHEYYLVHSILSGKGIFVIRGQEYQLRSGDSFFIFPGEMVRYESDGEEPWQYSWVGFRGQEADRILAQIGVGPHVPVLQGYRHHRLNALLRNVTKALHRGGHAGDMEAEGYFRLILSEYARAAGASLRSGKEDTRTDIERQVEQAARWLTLQHDKSISIDELAQKLGYHRTYLSKMFRKQMGESPMQFLLRIRMERARTLLLTTKLTMEQIAASVGYEDALYFSKLYKKWYKRSPTAHRAEMQRDQVTECAYR
ncbi:AraC family transcriptional regulator [Paenibacillus thiaminolyticus]|uniref:AraC family transcriptional regulator n=1 Tax=Paenibacillus thiaminolyticus TaxID=49283 RepID=UPI002543CD54|nr:AraC family transcriptional regulator [Paenibacillus thiaminolyticus]WII35795.1 AraC family transcriptional regulator [Paenibacillus thiaminolyticus]